MLVFNTNCWHGYTKLLFTTHIVRLWLFLLHLVFIITLSNENTYFNWTERGICFRDITWIQASIYTHIKKKKLLRKTFKYFKTFLSQSIGKPFCFSPMLYLYCLWLSLACSWSILRMFSSFLRLMQSFCKVY